MIIGTFFLAVALHVGIVLTVDLFTNQQPSTTTQSNHS
ncbi:transcriptional regulator [Lysinibacillus sp. NPDC097214]